MNWRTIEFLTTSGRVPEVRGARRACSWPTAELLDARVDYGLGLAVAGVEEAFGRRVIRTPVDESAVLGHEGEVPDVHGKPSGL